MRLAFLAAALVLGGCSSPVEGNWQSDTELGNGRRNEMSVSADGTAEATVFATPKDDRGNWVRFEFEAEWQQDGSEFDFDMECKVGPCDGNNFKMECEVIEEEADGDEKLNCAGSVKWQEYPFDWERGDAEG
jgi:hypothetical protein